MANVMRRLWRRVLGVTWVVTDIKTGEQMKHRSRRQVKPEDFGKRG